MNSVFDFAEKFFIDPATSTAFLAAVVASVFYYFSTRKKNEKHSLWWWNKSPVSGITSTKQPAAFLIGHAQHLSPDVIEGVKKLCVEDADASTGMCSFWLFSQPIVSVIKASHAHKMLQKSSHREKIALMDIHWNQFLGPKALVSLQHEEWKIHRRLIAKSFMHEHLKEMTSDMTKVGDKFIKSLKSGIHGDIRGENGIDIVNIMKKPTLDIIGFTSFNFDFNCCGMSGDPEMARAFKYLLQENSRRSFEAPLSPSSYFYWLPTDANREFKKQKNKINSLLNRLINERRKEMELSSSSTLSSSPKPQKKQHQNFLTLMLTAKDGENDKIKLSNRALVDNLMTFFFGGFDTTSIGLAYACHELAKHPNVAKKIRDEIMEVTDNGKDEIDYGRYTKMKYTLAVWKEVLRLYPPAPLTVRHLEMDVEVEGITIPKGTGIYIPIWWIHRDERNWDRPYDFYPERFLPSEKKVVESSASTSKNSSNSSFFAFSGGARNCIGTRFALLEGTILLAKLAQNFDFKIPESAPPVVPVSLGVVQEAKDGIFLQLKEPKN